MELPWYFPATQFVQTVSVFDVHAALWYVPLPQNAQLLHDVFPFWSWYRRIGCWWLHCSHAQARPADTKPAGQSEHVVDVSDAAY